MNVFTSVAAVAVTGLIAGQAAAAPIVSEDFESYADTAALGGVWSLSDGTLDNALGNPGNSFAHPGTGGSFSGNNTNSLSFAAVNPNATEYLTFKADIYDDGTSANKRVSAGLRAAAGANIIELGMYNSPSHYAYRAVLFDGTSPSWVAFTDLVDDAGAPISNSPVEGWHTFQMQLTDTEAIFTLDLNGDGNINATSVEPLTTNVAGFDIIRLGGPSDLSSAGGGANFDNISLEFVPIPAPSSAVLIGIGGLAAFGRRRRA